MRTNCENGEVEISETIARRGWTADSTLGELRVCRCVRPFLDTTTTATRGRAAAAAAAVANETLSMNN